jgi:hypothetical protein
VMKNKFFFTTHTPHFSILYKIKNEAKLIILQSRTHPAHRNFSLQRLINISTRR